MGQVPNDRRAHSVCFFDNGLHVVFAATAVIHLCDHYGGHLFCDVIQNIFWRWGAQNVAHITQSHQPFNHVNISGEVATV